MVVDSHQEDGDIDVPLVADAVGHNVVDLDIGGVKRVACRSTAVEVKMEVAGMVVVGQDVLMVDHREGQDGKDWQYMYEEVVLVVKVY